MRTQHGSEIWTSWQIPCLPGIPGMPQHQALSGEDRCEMSEMRKRDRSSDRSSKGRKFYSCEGYPDCDFVSWKRPEAPKEQTETAK